MPFQVEYYPIPNTDCVWAEDVELTTVSNCEQKLIDDAKISFPLHKQVSFDFAPLAGCRISGSGKIVGYVLRTALDVFNQSYVYLLVMGKNGLEKIVGDNINDL